MSFQESKVIDQVSETGGIFQKLRRGFETRTGRVGASVAIVMGSLTLNACATEATPQDTPSAIATDAPTDSPETEAPAEVVENNMGGFENDPAITEANTEQRLEELRFTAEMTPDQLAESYNDLMDGWSFAGATQETWYAWYEAGVPNEEKFAAEIAKKNTPVYAAALFGNDYASTTNQVILDTIARMEETNAREIMMFIRTYGDKTYPNQNTKNTEAWHYESEVLGVEVAGQSEEEVSIIVNKETQSNSQKNMYFDNVSWDGRLTDTALTFRSSSDNPNVKVVTSIDIKQLN